MACMACSLELRVWHLELHFQICRFRLQWRVLEFLVRDLQGSKGVSCRTDGSGFGVENYGLRRGGGWSPGD